MKIVTAVVNNPQFIEIQYYTLKKYFKGDYEFIVFNDAKTFPDFTNGDDITIKTQIEEMCATLHIQCIPIPNDHHRGAIGDPSIRCADSMNFMLQYQKAHPDQYLILDSDMFLVDDLDISKYTPYDAAILLQNRDDKNYFWHGICYLDFTKLNNIDLLCWDCIDKTDTGGGMQEWLLNQVPDEDKNTTSNTELLRNITYVGNIYFIRHLVSCKWKIHQLPKRLQQHASLIEFLKNDVRNINDKFFCELYDDIFLHYRAGCNWRQEGMETHRRLTQALKNALLE